MKKIYVICLALTAAVCASFSFKAQATENEDFDSFVEVNGYAEQEVAPDVFYMRVTINEQDYAGKKTLDEQQKAMVRSLKALGIDTDKALTRQSISSAFYKKKINYAVATYQLKLTAAEDVSRVWRALDNLGISNVSFTKAEYSKVDELKNIVRAQAAANAKEQASTLASAIGQTIGKCFYLYCGYSGSPVVYAQPRIMKSMAVNAMADGIVAEVEEESIDFDNIKISVSVSAKFVLN